MAPVLEPKITTKTEHVSGTQNRVCLTVGLVVLAGALLANWALVLGPSFLQKISKKAYDLS